MSEVRRVLIMGAAGRDFHNFNLVFRDNPACRVVAFTACQIPDIAGRTYPPELAGAQYPEGIPIYEESQLAQLIQKHGIDDVVFAYSDISHQHVMHLASRANAAGADFKLLGTKETMLSSQRPVISVCAVRTGCGKSQTSRRVAQILRQQGIKTVVVRHPMPYGDLAAQRCQRFETREDLDRGKCTIEEREEYEAHIDLGHVVFAGVDYGEILSEAEAEADVILWDGGNNDLPFFKSNLHIVLVDPHRAGHEVSYHPGETNLLMADVVLIAKTGSADKEKVKEVHESVSRHNPQARIIAADSVLSTPDPDAIRGRRVLVVEDGPTVTHGGMPYGAGYLAAQRWGAAEIVDPRPYAVGSIAKTFAQYPHLSSVLPAMGYSETQVAELKQTIESVPCDLVLVGTPFDLARLLEVDKPLQRVSYELDEAASVALKEEVVSLIKRLQLKSPV